MFIYSQNFLKIFLYLRSRLTINYSFSYEIKSIRVCAVFSQLLDKSFWPDYVRITFCLFLIFLITLNFKVNWNSLMILEDFWFLAKQDIGETVVLEYYSFPVLRNSPSECFFHKKLLCFLKIKIGRSVSTLYFGRLGRYHSSVTWSVNINTIVCNQKWLCFLYLIFYKRFSLNGEK